MEKKISKLAEITGRKIQQQQQQRNLYYSVSGYTALAKIAQLSCAENFL